MALFTVALLGLAAYLIGSIPPAYYLVRLVKGVDLREVGSKNVGTLNTYHHVGAWGAGLVLFLDVGKGALAVFLPALAAPWVDTPEWAVYVTGLLVVAGHNWTFLLGFRGGKGAATIIGVCLAYVPLPTLMALAPGILALLLARNAIVGLAVGYVIFNLLVIAVVAFGWDALVADPGIRHIGFCLLLSAMVTISYAVSIRAQLMNALRNRSIREVFYGS